MVNWILRDYLLHFNQCKKQPGNGLSYPACNVTSFVELSESITERVTSLTS